LIPDPLASWAGTDAAAMGWRHAEYHQRHHQRQLLHRVVSWPHQLKWALRSSRIRRRWPARRSSSTGTSLSLAPLNWSNPVPGPPSRSRWGAWSAPSSWRWHHSESRPCLSRGLGVCSPESDLGRHRPTGFLVGAPQSASLCHSPPGGRDHLAGGNSSNLGARSQAPSSLGSGA